MFTIKVKIITKNKLNSLNISLFMQQLMQLIEILFNTYIIILKTLEYIININLSSIG